ncbi:MAG: adenosylcobinamide-phosphate synthase CbiB [Bacillota bacterium]|jgi:adenosylcobinamide-phosphate synthase
MSVYISVILDFIFGDPKGFPHPIRLVGGLVSLYEKIFYRGNKKVTGLLFLIAVLATVIAVLGGLLWLCARWKPLYWIVSVYLMYTSLAWRSLKKETGYVFEALRQNNLQKARRMTGYVVGRDTENLTEEEMIKACVETIGENTIDGVIAPLFYMIIGWFCGFPVIFAYVYKTINTLDSMVGYKNDRYRDFGSWSARLDDIVNWMPARLGSLLMLAAGFLCRMDVKNGWKIFRRDRFAHSSPNSAQSESVYAGLLGLELGGAHYYFGKEVVKPTIGDALRAPDLEDHKRSCRIMDVTVLLTMALFTVFYILSIVL